MKTISLFNFAPRLSLYLLLSVCGLLFQSANQVFSQNVVIPDTAFLYALIEEGVDSNGDSLITYEEAKEITYLYVSEKNISDMTGIEAFINLDSLLCYRNNMTRLDLSKITALKYLECSGNKLTSLNVSKNIAITALNCNSNQLTWLDITKNQALTSLNCGLNQLPSLDVSYNPGLTSLDCAVNQLSSLDVSNNSALKELYCYSNQITRLDISNNTELRVLFCADNHLSNLDLRNMNWILEYVNIGSMPSLHQVCFDSIPNMFIQCDTICVNAKTDFYTEGSPNIFFTTECNYDSIVLIPDTAFLFALIDTGVDTNGDSLINIEEAEKITQLNVSEKNISDLTGIEAFVNLTSLNCSNNKLSSLDVSNNIHLSKRREIFSSLPGLDCSNNQLSRLDISNNTKLKSLACNNNQLTSLDVSDCAALTSLLCSNNQISDLEVSGCTALSHLNCSYNQLTSLDVSNNTSLTILKCYHNRLTSLDVSNNIHLQRRLIRKYVTTSGLDCSYNQLTSLDLSSNTKLGDFSCHHNQLTSLNVSNNTVLTDISCSNNQLTSLDISGCTALSRLNCSYNQLTSLDVSNNTALKWLNCGDNQLNDLDVSENLELSSLDCSNNQISSLDISNNDLVSTYNYIFWHDVIDLSDMPGLYQVCVSENFQEDSSKLNTEGSPNIIFTTECNYNSIVLIPDTAFLAALIEEGVDITEDSVISYGEAERITNLDVASKNISDLTGIEAFIHLADLNCSGNQLTNLDLSRNNLLLSHDGYGTGRDGELNLSNMPTLRKVCVWDRQFPPRGKRDQVKTTGSPNIYFSLECYNLINVIIPDTAFLQALIRDGVDTNEDSLISNIEAWLVTDLMVSGWYLQEGERIISDLTGIEAFVNLTELDCRYNQLSSLDVSANTALRDLRCGENQLSNLDVSTNPSLQYLYCSENKLTNLDVSTNVYLQYLYCSENQLTNLDVSTNASLKYLIGFDNQLTNLDVSSNTALTELSIENIPTLHEVCVWDSFFTDSVNINIDTTASPNVEFKDCSGTTGIEKSGLKELSIYPNPTQHFLTIEAQNNEYTSLEIHDLSGKLIYQEEMEGNSKQIDLTTFTNGIYFLTVRSKDRVLTERVLKF